MPPTTNSSTTNPPAPNERRDDQTPVAELKALVAEFVAERDWRKYHAPKNLAMALAIEAAELMEHFQWLDAEESRRLADGDPRLADIGEELADVVGYAMAMANELGIDLATTMRAKMVKNRLKYPAEEFRGRLSSSREEA